MGVDLRRKMELGLGEPIALSEFEAQLFTTLKSMFHYFSPTGGEERDEINLEKCNIVCVFTKGNLLYHWSGKEKLPQVL